VAELPKKARKVVEEIAKKKGKEMKRVRMSFMRMLSMVR